MVMHELPSGTIILMAHNQDFHNVTKWLHFKENNEQILYQIYPIVLQHEQHTGNLFLDNGSPSFILNSTCPDFGGLAGTKVAR